jgi:hypothetical protein
LLAPDAAQQIQAEYSPFVSSELITEWVANPTSAPGRLTSSPWPDRIEVSLVALVETGRYVIEGQVIEATSAGDSGSYPLVIALEQVDGRWVIVSYEAGDRP